MYGPLSNRAITLMFESIPTYPDFGRYWQVIDKHQVNLFYTAPTALRALMKEGNDWVTQHSRATLRLLGTVGEPIKEPEWLWYYNIVGDGRCPIVDTWWQTETGGILMTPLPGATPLKPGSATLPFFAIEPVILDEEGNEVEGQSSTRIPVYEDSVARHNANRLREPRTLPRNLLRSIPRILYDRRWYIARRRRLLLDYRER